MLNLDQTALLLDGLKPPPGMDLDVAVGTTFTLDLTALLAVPVAATFASDERGEESANLLEIIRRYADRTVLFCQAGAISVPPKYRTALTFIEDTVVEVPRPPGGIFHPKVWVVRFSGRGRKLHRTLVMSRNLTFDRSWDVIVRLDEDPRASETMSNAGLVDFLDDLGARATGRLNDPQSELLQDLVRTVSTARFEVPSPFESGAFVPLLANRSGQPFWKSCERALAISPFLSAGAAASFLESASAWSGIISRPASLDAAADGARKASRVLRLKDAVENAERTIDDTFDADTPDEHDGTRHLRGLHAKTYVQDHGDRATCWIGSANLTAGAFATNVEMMVRLTGPVRQVGVNAVLSPTPLKTDLSWFVENHVLPDAGGQEITVLEADGLSELEAHVLDLASSDAVLRLTEVDDLWIASLVITPWEPDDGVSVRARLLSLDGDLKDVTNGQAQWAALSLGHITPFVVLEVKAGSATRHALLRARLDGDPPDRRRNVIANAIASRDDFLRYLAALLGIDLGIGAGPAGDGLFAGNWLGGPTGGRVLEDLLVTAAREPTRLASLNDTIQVLLTRDDTQDIVPEDFQLLWEAVYQARKAAIQ